jgi:hypothetical protein
MTLRIIWALGLFVRPFTSLVDPGDIYPPQVEAHNLLVTTMSTPIQIDSASGRIRADSICLNVSVEIRGIAFPANLIVMGT